MKKIVLFIVIVWAAVLFGIMSWTKIDDIIEEAVIESLTPDLSLPDGWTMQRSDDGDYRWVDTDGYTDIFNWPTYAKAAEWARAQYAYRVSLTNTVWNECEPAEQCATERGEG